MQAGSLPRRVLVMVAGILLMPAGVLLFKISAMGNDPYTAMVIALAAKLGVEYAFVLIGCNCVLFVAEILWGRKLIGIGTLVNALCIGPLTSLYERGLLAVWTAPTAFGPRLALMGVGILVLTCSCAMYQTADVGISPYDATAFLLTERLKKPYFWCRIACDAVCAAAAWALGGIVGLGTLVCAVGLGPFITFFTRFVAEPLVGAPTASGREETA